MAKINMSSIEQPATQADFDRWAIVSVEAAKLKEEEMTLRKKIFRTYFPEPVEGVNSLPMAGEGGYVLKATYKINRKLVPEQYSAMAAEFKEAKLPLKDLVVTKLDLSVSAYKNLSEEDQELFDKALEISPGAPTLEVVKPKRA